MTDQPSAPADTAHRQRMTLKFSAGDVAMVLESDEERWKLLYQSPAEGEPENGTFPWIRERGAYYWLAVITATEITVAEHRTEGPSPHFQDFHLLRNGQMDIGGWQQASAILPDAMRSLVSEALTASPAD